MEAEQKNKYWKCDSGCDSLKVWAITWPLGETVSEIDGIPFITESTKNSRDSLPVEFFSHQLLELDWQDTDKAVDFMVRYGVPRWPRKGKINKIIGLGSDAAMVDAAIKTTNKYIFYGDWEAPFYICLDEALLTIKWLQKAVEDLFENISGQVNSGWLAGSLISEGATSPYVLHRGLRTAPDFNLTNAICNQIIETMASDLSWKICACEGCGRPFKRFQPGLAHAPKTDRRPNASKSKYCCKKCQDRQGKRNQRAAAKNRIQH